MKVVGFDTAKGKMGFSVFADGFLVDWGELRPVGGGPRHAIWRGGEKGPTFETKRHALLFLLGGATHVVAEQAWIGLHVTAGLAISRVMGQLEVTAEEAGVKEWFEVSPAAWRELCGRHFGSPFPKATDPAKAKAVELVSSLVGRAVTDNEAESVLASVWLLVGIYSMTPQFGTPAAA